MDDQFSDSVSAELSYLNQLLEEYAGRHPKIANRLRHGARDSAESRLMQAFSFLTARTQRRIDAEYPSILKPLVDMIGMAGPASIPSLTTVEFVPRLDQLPDLEGTLVPRGTELHTEQIDGVTIQFQTCTDVMLWPIELAAASLELPPFHGAGAAASEATCAVKLKLRTPGGQATFDEIAADRLRFFIHADRDDALRLHDALFADILDVCVRVEEDGRLLSLGARTIRSCDSADDERLFPGEDRDGGRRLVEFLAYPERFFYFDLHGLDQAFRQANGTEAEIYVYLHSEKESAPRSFPPDGIRLYSTPAVNLIQRQTTPIDVRARSDRITLAVDADSETHSIHSIRQVHVRGPDDKEVEVPRFHTLQRPLTGETDGLYWEYDDLERTAISSRGARVALRFVDRLFEPKKIEESVVSATVVCSNGDLPMKVVPGANGTPLQTDGVSCASCQCVHPPTRLRRLALAKTVWERVSQSLPDPLTMTVTDGAAALQAALQVLASDEDAVLQALITSLSDVRIERTAGIVSGEMMCHGIEITLVFARSKRVPRGHLLLADMLKYFLAHYVTEGVFFRLRAVYQDGKDVWQWPTRSGARSVI